MPTGIYLRCPQPCGLPLRLVRIDSRGNRTYRCHDGHEVRHSAAYSKRHALAVNNPGKVPANCPVCQKPIREKGPVAAANAKELGRIDCSSCETTLLYNEDNGAWVLAEEAPAR